MPTVEEDKVITAAAKIDPDAQPLTQRQLEAMLPARSLRGRPPSPNKKLLVSINGNRILPTRGNSNLPTRLAISDRWRA
jgi:hypothetical protein